MTPKQYDILILLAIAALMALIVFHVVPNVREGIAACNEAAVKYDECSAQTQQEMVVQDTMPIFKINISDLSEGGKE